MIFLSAQPAETYILWQLEIQLKNFSDLGITANHFHILFGYDEALGLSPLVTDFISANQDFASFYAYPDSRWINHNPLTPLAKNGLTTINADYQSKARDFIMAARGQ